MPSEFGSALELLQGRVPPFRYFDHRGNEQVSIMQFGLPVNSSAFAYLVDESHLDLPRVSLQLSDKELLARVLVTPPTISESRVIQGWIGVKSHWYDGELRFERPGVLEVFEKFRRIIRSCLTHKLVYSYYDGSGPGIGKTATRCSDAVVEWYLHGNRLVDQIKSPFEYLPVGNDGEILSRDT